jgi:hypothetical protein
MERTCRRVDVAMAVAVALALGGATPARSADVGGADGWNVSFGGLINAFATNAHWDVGNNEEQTTRVMSGFNPSKLNVHVKAPKSREVEVSGHFQLAPSIQSNKSRFAGQSLEVRVAEVDVTGKFGTLEIGRGWGIFSAQAIINDTASGLGVGRIPSPDRGGPTFGRIGTGYTWTDFAAKVVYATPTRNGFSLRAGIFDPVETPFGGGSLPANSGGTGVGALETKTPRVEAEANYAVKSGSVGFKVWAGALGQSIRDKGTDSKTSIRGFDGGARLDASGFAVTGAYTTTKGVGPSGFQANGFVCDAAGCRSSTTDFWYGGVDYSFGTRKTTIGASTGQGKQKARDGFGKVDNRLDMAFIQHQLFPQLFVMVEYHRFKTTTGGAVSEKYHAYVVGTQFNF